MLSSCSTAGVFAALLAISTASCSDSQRPCSPADDSGVLRSIQEGYCASHSIVNVTLAPGTYHWEDPLHLLTSAEGFGPRSLSLTVADSISPSASESSTYTPSNSEISSSVGYDLGATFELDASTSILVPFGGYARVQAFASFAMTTWDIIGTNCVGAVDGGTGVSFKPVGVYFKTCEALDCSLGGGVVGGGAGGGPMLSGPVPSGAGGADGGTNTSGATGAGGA